MQTIPIATREQVDIPAGSYLAIHSENTNPKVPPHIADLFAHFITHPGQEHYPALLHTPDGQTIKNIDTGEAVGIIKPRKEKHGFYLLVFHTDTPKTETVLLTVLIFDVESKHDAQKLLEEHFSNLVAENRVKVWESYARTLVEKGVSTERVQQISDLIRKSIREGNTAEGLAAAETALQEAVIEASKVLQAQADAAMEAHRKIQEEENYGN